MPGMRQALVVAGAFAGLVAACAWDAPRLPEADGGAPANFPEQHYLQAAARGGRVFRVDPASSRVVIEVRRGGPLARLGHDHVVASHDLHGYIAPGEGRADLYVALDQLVVDEPELRAEAGFDTQPTEDDIAGTRRNMLDKVLDADRHPFAIVAVNDNEAGGNRRRLRVVVTLHGLSRSVETAAQVKTTADEILVTGTFSIEQSQFGIAPFSVLGGAIAVQDRVNITYRINARRMEEADRVT